MEIDLHFGKDEVGNFVIEGWVKTELWLVCQRCLEPMRFTVQTKVRLGLVRTELAMERLGSGYEPLLVNEEPVSLVAIVEDELIMALPIVPTHPETLCSTPSEYSAQGLARLDPQDNPFAVLASIRNRD